MELSLPEIRRRWDAECTPSRLGLGVVTATVIGATFFSLTLKLGGDKFDCFSMCLGAAMLTLIGYGTVRVAASVSEERRQGTWDLLRLTPLTSLEIALGKMIGAPLYALVLAAALLPWIVLSVGFSPKGAPAHSLPILVEYACMTFGAWALGLLFSSLADERLGNSDGTRFVLLAALIPLAGSTLSRIEYGGGPKSGQWQTFLYAGSTTTCWMFDALTWLIFGAWAFEAARWRIGLDKLEPRSPWRISAFIVFLVYYFSGFPAIGIETVVLYPYIVVLVASLAEPWGLGQWGRWLSQTGWSRLTRSPVWMRGALTFGLVAVAISLVPHAADDGNAFFARRFPIMLAVFAFRDIFFLQWCRMRIKKNPEIFAVVYIALAYALPAIIAEWSFLFSAMANKNFGFAANVLPGVLEAALAAAVLARAAREPSRAAVPDAR